tara:strand:+ start:394 stop:795 length:402 start_codon:yes stop_codon:yes gene_type:complete
MVSIIKIDSGAGVLDFTILPETGDKIISLVRPSTTTWVSLHTNTPNYVNYQVPVGKKFTIISITKAATGTANIYYQPTADSGTGANTCGSDCTVNVANQPSPLHPFGVITAGYYITDISGAIGDMIWGIESNA